MTSKFATHILKVQPNTGDAPLYASGAIGIGGQLSARELPDALAGRKWPRLMRLTIAIGFASSLWIVLLARLYV
ncbi:MAG: hypothetical protein U0975_16510 [Erythrobacter sp.]|nr:hypothetical protein [Erythrobacter sp.]MDZ4274262.1 hypothetical protein [Erythrobacter sp.]